MIKSIQVGQQVRVAYIDEFVVTGRIDMAYNNYRNQVAYIVKLDQPIHVYGATRAEVSVTADQILEVIEHSAA